MTPRERAYQLRDALRAREIALDVTAVNAVEAAILADRAERDAVRESADVAYERALAEQAAGEAERTAQAEMARDVAWVRAACCAAPGPRSFLRTGLVTTKTDDIIEAVCSGATDADIAAAIRAARGENR